MPRAEKLDQETKRLRSLSPGQLADDAGAAKLRTEAIKEEMIRRGLRRAESAAWKLALTPPGGSNRTDKERLLQVLGVSESEYAARFTHVVHTDWTMRCSAKKAPRAAPEG
jgi:hypothetical protein